MRETIRQRNWLRHLAVALTYFALYSALRYVSFSYWFLPASLRLLCLLLLPYRYWPALALGEMLGLGRFSLQCYEEFGLTGALLNLVPRIALVMPIVRWCRERLSLLGPRRQVRMNALLLCAMLLALVTATYDWCFLRIMPVQPGQSPTSFVWAPRYFIGNYLGILTMVPLVLMLWQIAGETPTWRAARTRLGGSRLALEGLALLVPSLLLLAWIAVSFKDLGQVARMAMFLPVAVLAMRHGWRGAALGGFVASSALVVVVPAPYDPVTLQAEVFMAFTLSVLLMLGARIATLHAREEMERMNSRLALQSAQHGLYLGELRMQQAADTLQDVGTAIHHAHERLLDRMRLFLPEGEERRYSRQAIATRQEVFNRVNSLAPRAWQTNGLAHLLQEGSLAHALQNLGITYVCDIRGTGLAGFSPGFQLALYRLACEAAVYVHEQISLSSLRLRVRAGRVRGTHWAVLQMTGTPLRSDDTFLPSRRECDQFRERLGATADGVGGIRHNARIYRGTVHARATEHATRLSLVIYDGDSLSGRSH
ncbi:MASE1 domain-containing protein [Paraburkholderia aspalathi]|uniref:Signal transduction histidine kinase, glucose-6-phosphate specific n=1 Tax=Paraburkholderia aspalathi TaxID=1324617 RepID=A0A1I7ABT7_9BURK|nr:MASE1 domain-containing protein [Paraburkholderia aspalathi]SFT72388.1 Signal transduction histidine kinase, glucose-6-phosphate specific [Paraburkholderia aspalathi]